MALAMRITLLAVAAMAVLSTASAVTYDVGGPAGDWTLGLDYGTWVSDKKFLTGDSIVFKYSQAHDLLEVIKADYDSCTTTGPITTSKTGDDTVLLYAVGTRYFICGVGTHCNNGMKVTIDVTAGSSPSPPAPANGPSASNSPPPSPAPANGPSASNSPPPSPPAPASGPGASNSAPPPPESSAATSVGATAGLGLVISISIVVPMLVVVVIVLSCLIWRKKRKPKTSTYDPTSAPKPNSAPVSMTSRGDHVHNSENRQFTYKELEKFTNKFERCIGQGGFGLVYYGRLEDDTEVAVKMRSESSSHGLDEFLAEVNSLSKVHHRNLVSLVGYCWEKDHLAIVYEYMSQGSLSDHLRGKKGMGETLSWGTRVRIVLESAQGLDYLHKGCSLPIIHRDVKTNNILLGQNLRAKIADFGLCKTYLSETQTHISTNAAGSAGYMDPEYYHTGWLTESSDVYSFGVVLLEVATGEAPILPGQGHIVQRMKQKIARGNVSMVADVKLGGAYDVNSMWKLVDTAMACTADAASQRPTMAVVVAQLKESLALEESHEDSS